MKKPLKEKLQIEKKHIILCEVMDDERFLCNFLSYSLEDKFSAIQVINVMGVENIPEAIALLPVAGGFENLKSLVIVIDSDDNPQGASESIQRALRECKLPVPSRPCQLVHSDDSCDHTQLSVGYALFPGLDQECMPGALEDLCLEILSDRPNVNKNALMDIVNESIKKAEDLNRPFRCKHKNRLHTYFSLSNEFVGAKIGGAAGSNAFDFSAGVFAPLKDLIERCLQND